MGVALIHTKLQQSSHPSLVASVHVAFWNVGPRCVGFLHRLGKVVAPAAICAKIESPSGARSIVAIEQWIESVIALAL